jgi:hypothetical protein
VIYTALLAAGEESYWLTDLHFTAGSRRGKLLADTLALNKIHLYM